MSRRGAATVTILAGAILALSTAIPARAAEEKVIITPFTGWVFGGKANTVDGSLRIQETADYGINLDVPYQGSGSIRMRFSYSTYDTTVEEWVASTGQTSELFDMRVDQYQIGGTNEIDHSGRMQSYLLGTFGVTHFSPRNSRNPGINYSSETLFSMNFGLGMDVMLTKRLGLNLQGRLLLPINYYGGSLFCGSGGCNIGISGGSSLLQADVTAGLVMRF